MDIKAIIERANEFMSKDDITKPILEEAVKEATDRAASVVERRMKELKEVVEGMKEINAQFEESLIRLFAESKAVCIVKVHKGDWGNHESHIELQIDNIRQEVGSFDRNKDKEYIALVVMIEKEKP